ncbi:PREDICTED: uroporphyrinogen-III synthase [Dufourea novaeangliae]|uniref:Uroporphyrinogen-III synthase n=1 Tax=Dufourea novaeangliae TaxID=178035 RepID=A0A154P2W5_DUFNO|nr:PREDICTED: uroporphyrinogen-III synthase [Dufourea novaeangliae]KZC06266.1 Uroporphyrinogen-III synthase [Dufourea novaeangliae]
MAPRYERVVLCRGGLSEKNDSQEVYVKTLKTAGYSCNCLPTLCFNFVNTPELRTCLHSPGLYYGLILTSKRAVEAINLASKENDRILLPWRTLPVYCVGPATESFARSHLGSENCFGSKAGNAKELAELLVASVGKESKPLLYPCSEIGRETIEKTLTENSIRVNKIIVYRTLPSETLEQDLSEFIDNEPRIFAFFSPSAVECIMTILKRKCYDMSNIKAAAIGPVTGQALLDAGLTVFAIASKPDPVSLLKSIKDAERSEVLEETEGRDR